METIQVFISAALKILLSIDILLDEIPTATGNAMKWLSRQCNSRGFDI